MNNPYGFHSSSARYHEERFAQASRRHFAKGGVGRSALASSLLVTLALIAILLGASACTEASTSAGTPTASPNPSASEKANTATSSSSSGHKDAADNNNNKDTDSASTEQYTASAEQYTASPSASASASSSASVSASASAQSVSALEANYAGVRNTVGMSPSTSIECYSFHSNGTVDLRHNGTSAPDDTGTYRLDATGGQISWNSGRASTVVVEGENLLINDLKLTQVSSCTPASSSASSSSSASASAVPAGDYVGTRSSTDMECYSFADGNVELRRQGAYAPSDTGVYRGDSTGGTISWNSGGSSTVTVEGGSLFIEGLKVDPIESCLVPTLR